MNVSSTSIERLSEKKTDCLCLHYRHRPYSYIVVLYSCLNNVRKAQTQWMVQAPESNEWRELVEESAKGPKTYRREKKKKKGVRRERSVLQREEETNLNLEKRKNSSIVLILFWRVMIFKIICLVMFSLRLYSSVGLNGFSDCSDCNTLSR